MNKRFVFAASVMLVAVDQLLKWYAPSSPPPNILGRDFFVRTLNHGIAFSLPVTPWLLTALLAVGVAAVLLMAWREERKGSERVGPLILILAGAVSNIIDRVRVGAVVDYFSLVSLGFSFNLADCLIVAGVTMIIVKNFERGAKQNNRI